MCLFLGTLNDVNMRRFGVVKMLAFEGVHMMECKSKLKHNSICSLLYQFIVLLFFVSTNIFICIIDNVGIFIAL